MTESQPRKKLTHQFEPKSKIHQHWNDKQKLPYAGRKGEVRGQRNNSLVKPTLMKQDI
jgi:hypothetical protein